VIALTPYDAAKEFAHIILPIGTFAETSGTFVNLEGRWQSVPGAAKPVGESRPGWKVLRVLGTLLNVPGFEYESAEQVRDELKSVVGSLQPDNKYLSKDVLTRAGSRKQVLEVPIYSIDPIVRRAASLQQTKDALSSSRGAQA
jgi:NADH-quinone oxidoreductase subunit G